MRVLGGALKRSHYRRVKREPGNHDGTLPPGGGALRPDGATQYSTLHQILNSPYDSTRPALCCRCALNSHALADGEPCDSDVAFSMIVLRTKTTTLKATA